MSEKRWTDRIVGDRMAVDDAFTDRVEASRFSRQEWGLVMTATEFEIERPEDAERARLVANTEKLPAVIPELDRIRSQTGGMGGGGSGGAGSGGGGGGGAGSGGGGAGGGAGSGGGGAGGGGSGGKRSGTDRSTGGVFGSIKRAIGLGSKRNDDETIEAAERLTGEYASELQRRLEERGRWDEIRDLAGE